MAPDRDPSMMFSGYPLALRRCLNFKRPSSNVLFEDETIFYAWWVARGEVRRLEGLGFLWVLTSQMESFANLSPLNTVLSRKVIWLSDISAVNLIVGWK